MNSEAYETHGHHDSPRIVFGDECKTCVARATGGLDGLGMLDDRNLRKLAQLATEKHKNPGMLRPSELGASYSDMKAVETLRHAARVVDISGIDMDAAR